MYADSFYPTIDEDDYTIIMIKLRKFFFRKGYDEGFYDGQPKILAACEDWNNIIPYEQGDGLIWPLPQTRQMHMEYSLMGGTKHRKGIFACGVSYRPEPHGPKLGRHHRQFPLFEWETWGGIEVHDQIIDELLLDLGFKPKEFFPAEMPCTFGRQIAHGTGYITETSALKYAFPRVDFKEVVEYYKIEQPSKGTHDIGHQEEEFLERDLGTCVITGFTKESDPFFNMGRDVSTGKYYKRDAIIGGKETIGSAAREVDPLVIYKNFFKSGKGEFYRTLYRHFGEERVQEEFMHYITLFYNDVPIDELQEKIEDAKWKELKPYLKPMRERERCGGGIGMTRLIQAAKDKKLMQKW